MGRNKDSLAVQGKAYARYAQPAMSNLALPGMNGYITNLEYYHASKDYVRKNVIVKLVEPARGFLLMDNSREYLASLKNIIETYTHNWDGFNRTLTVNSSETPIGAAGEVFQTPTSVKRARSELTQQIVEKEGKPIIRFFEDYVRYLIMDPDLTFAALSTVSTNFTDQLPDIYANTIIAFEPDNTFTKVQDAWLITNFFPNGQIGDHTARFDKAADGETVTHSIAWAGIQKVGANVDALAQGFLDAMRISGTDPTLQPAFVRGIDANVQAATWGFTEQVQDANRTFVAP